MTSHSQGDAEGRSAGADRPGRPLGLLALCASVALLSGVVAFVAIGNGSVSTAAGAERLEVSFDEWDLDTDANEIPAGRVTVAVANDGGVDHELLIVKTDLAPGDLPQGLSGPDPKLSGELVLGKPHQHISTNDSYAVLNREPDANTKDHVLPGEELAIDTELDPGSYVLYCNLPGHYNRGQYKSLTVTAPDSGQPGN